MTSLVFKPYIPKANAERMVYQANADLYWGTLVSQSLMLDFFYFLFFGPFMKKPLEWLCCCSLSLSPLWTTDTTCWGIDLNSLASSYGPKINVNFELSWLWKKDIVEVFQEVNVVRCGKGCLYNWLGVILRVLFIIEILKIFAGVILF